MSKLGIWVAALVMVAILLTGAFCFVVNWTQRDYEFKQSVRSHMENAYYSADPNTMEVELVAAKDGMRSLGLEEYMYSEWLPWEKTPDKRMDWQYRHMDSVLVRVEEFRRWESTQTTIESSQQFQDVYTQKLDNVRHFIKDDGGWSDDVAEGAFALNNYFFTTVMPIFLLIGFCSLMVVIWILISID